MCALQPGRVAAWQAPELRSVASQLTVGTEACLARLPELRLYNIHEHTGPDASSCRREEWAACQGEMLWIPRKAREHAEVYSCPTTLLAPSLSRKL
jgi:hypothetical protein